MASSVARVEDEVAGLRDLDPVALRARWRVVTGRPAPKGLSRHLLLRMLAYRIQAKAFGDLSRDSMRVLDRISGAEPVPAARTEPRSGTVLVREWNGVRHHVMAVEGGFAWSGGTYRSLSEVARAITGTNWSGPRFFGLGGGIAEAREGAVSARLRCAIYTRVSTEHGLDQEFNSLDNQREAAEAYVKSQAHEGWTCGRERFDDGGFSGGSIERPALQRLLEAIRHRKIDVVVVYKVDRLTRSLADFAKLVELFDGHGVSFVSVTQAFNTTTSMGRLTLNVLLSFAQFEREVTSERIRDKIAVSKRRGLWVGGMVPLGYAVEARKIVVVEPEAERVRHTFRRYLALGSLGPLLDELHRDGILTKVRPLATGRTIGGIAFTRGPLAALLHNRFYIAEIAFKGAVHPAEHPAILDRQLFEAVQAKLQEQRNGRIARRGASGALLTGRIYDELGRRMSPTHANKRGRRYRYYITASRPGDREPLRRIRLPISNGSCGKPSRPMPHPASPIASGSKPWSSASTSLPTAS